MEKLAAALQALLAVQGFLVMKLSPEDRRELDEVLRLRIADMSPTTDNWSSHLDPQKYRDALSFELQQILKLPRQSDLPSGDRPTD